MTYTVLVFKITAGESYQKDLFIDALAVAGFDTFEDTPEGFNAYTPSSSLNPGDVDILVRQYAADGFYCSYLTNQIAPRNWNQVWESNFEPLLIGNSCYVRATFHEPKPEYRYEIVIDPKMAFGTGHHHTTSLMIEYLLELDLRNQTVLDMGCGTGILAILAMKAGAARTVAIDNDPVCYESSIENSQLNDAGEIVCLCGSASEIPDERFDTIAANINRNILLAQLGDYAKALMPGGTLLLSGFYELPDLEMITSAASSNRLHRVDFKKSGDWIAARFLLS